MHLPKWDILRFAASVQRCAKLLLKNRSFEHMCVPPVQNLREPRKQKEMIFHSFFFGGRLRSVTKCGAEWQIKRYTALKNDWNPKDYPGKFLDPHLTKKTKQNKKKKTKKKKQKKKKKKKKKNQKRQKRFKTENHSFEVTSQWSWVIFCYSHYSVTKIVDEINNCRDIACQEFLTRGGPTCTLCRNPKSVWRKKRRVTDPGNPIRSTFVCDPPNFEENGKMLNAKQKRKPHTHTHTHTHTWPLLPDQMVGLDQRKSVHFPLQLLLLAEWNTKLTSFGCKTNLDYEAQKCAYCQDHCFFPHSHQLASQKESPHTFSWWVLIEWKRLL